MRKTIWLGLLLTVAFAATIYSAECDSLRLIRVKGDAVVSVPPDKAVITLSLESRQEKLENAKQQLDSLMEIVTNLAKEFKIPEKDVHTERYVIVPVNPKRTKHSVKATLVVTVTDLTVLNPFLSRAVDAGVDEVRSVSLQLLDPLAIRIRAREEAADVARRKAEAILKALGASLGRVHSVVDAPGSQTMISAGLPASVNKFRVVETSDEAQTTEPSIAIGQIEERASVEVSFEIAQ